MIIINHGTERWVPILLHIGLYNIIILTIWYTYTFIHIVSVKHQCNKLVFNQRQQRQCYIKAVFTILQQRDVHGASVKMSTACVESLCWVDNYRQPYNALPTGNQDIASSLAQWGLTKSHGWPSPSPWYY